MIARRAGLLLVILAFCACLQPPVTESLQIRILPHGASVVAIGVSLRDPSEYDRSPRVKQRLENEARELAEGVDPWSDRLRRVDPVRQSDTIDREHGGIRRVTRRAELAGPDDLRELFRDTDVGVTYAEGDGWAELTLVPDRPSRATSAQRLRVKTELDAFAGHVAEYAGAIKRLYDYLDQHPDRARPALGEVFSVRPDDETLNEDEQALVADVNDAIGALVTILDADPGDPFTLDELSRLVYDPFPAPILITVPGPVTEREGFPGELGAELRIPMISIWSAFTRLEGRWIAPDPALALWRDDAAETGQPFDLDGFLAQRRRAQTVTASEVRRAIEKELKPREVYRARWTAP